MSIELNKYIFDAVIMFYENCFEYLFIMNKHFIFIIFDVDSGWLFAKFSSEHKQYIACTDRYVPNTIVTW